MNTTMSYNCKTHSPLDVRQTPKLSCTKREAGTEAGSGKRERERGIVDIPRIVGRERLYIY